MHSRDTVRTPSGRSEHLLVEKPKRALLGIQNETAACESCECRRQTMVVLAVYETLGHDRSGQFERPWR